MSDQINSTPGTSRSTTAETITAVGQILVELMKVHYTGLFQLGKLGLAGFVVLGVGLAIYTGRGDLLTGVITSGGFLLRWALREGPGS